MKNDPVLTAWRTWQYAQSLSIRTVGSRIETIERFGQALRCHPKDATIDDVVEWLAKGEHWRPSTRRTYYKALVAWFKWLQRAGHRLDNPMVQVPPPKVPRAVPRPVTNANLRRVLATRMHKRTRVMILLYAFAGLRCSEIAAIRGENFDLVERTVTVTGKGGVTATLPLHPLIMEAAWSMPRTGYWFPSNASTNEPHLLGHSVGTIIKRVMIRAGVQGSAHCLRHWFGTELVSAGVDLRTTQELMRHASLATTAVYTQIADARKAEGVERLDPWRSSEGTAA